MQVQRFSREEFLSDYLDVRPGEHVNVISPTGGGKTHLLYQILGKFLDQHPHIRAVSFMPKGRDETTEQWAKALSLRETESWPPSKEFWKAEPRGHVLWPKHIRDDEDADREHIHGIFKRAINDLYWQGKSVAFIDDAYLIGVMYSLNSALDRHWIAGRSSRASLFTSLQKPSGTVSGAVSSFAYDSPTHLFFGRDNDVRNLKRISEISISQLDPARVAQTVSQLPVHRINDSAVSEMLYIDRRGPYVCQIGI